MEINFFFHTITIGLIVAMGALGAGIGQGITGKAALDVLTIQPHAHAEISRAFVLGVAVLETTAIFALVVSAGLFSTPQLIAGCQAYHYCAEVGIGIAMSIIALTAGILTAYPLEQAFYAIARQPFFGQKIQTLMIITVAMMQTPLVFGLIISFLMRNQLSTVDSMAEAVRLIAIGLCIGIGSIGTLIGLSRFASQACQSVGFNPESYPRILSFVFVSGAFIETPLILAFLISILLLQFEVGSVLSFMRSSTFLASGLAMGLGTLGPACAGGTVAANACKQIALVPEHYTLIMRTSMLAQVLIDTCSLYAFLIALFLLFY